MMRVAIVGASKLTKDEEEYAKIKCREILIDMRADYGIGLILISGGAKGVDTIAEKIAKELHIDTVIFTPRVQKWEDEGGLIGFKTRNIKIANDCDKLYCIPSHYRDEPCIHCGTDKHQKSGGCWTMKQAKLLGKQTFLISPK